MSERTVEVEVRDLLKVADVLGMAVGHHRARDEANAALHMAATVRYSPLTSALSTARENLLALVESR